MPNLADIEELAQGLPEKQRAALATRLLQSLAPILDDEDEGIAVALERNAEWDANPSIGLTQAEFNARLRSRRPE